MGLHLQGARGFQSGSRGSGGTSEVPRLESEWSRELESDMSVDEMSKEAADVDPSGWDHPQPHVLAVSPQAADIDGLDHTNNAVYVQWCERVAWSHSEHLGLSLDDYRRLDRAMAIRQGVYDYLLPSFLGEPLLLGTWLTAGDGKLAMQRSFQLRRASDGQTLMRGRWELVCIEISTGRPRRMPQEFLEVYQAVVVTSDASVAARNPSTA